MSNWERSTVSQSKSYGINWGNVIKIGLLALLVCIAVVGIFVWTACRIEPPTGYFSVLVRKDGDDLPANEIVATQGNQKGIQLETLSEGRYFYNPLFWDWKHFPLLNIPQQKVGVMVRQFGGLPPTGEFLVSDSPPFQRGIVRQPLRPGTYRINPYAYTVRVFDAVTVKPGEVGIVTLRYGKAPSNPNSVLVKEGERGVQPVPLYPGTYYLNPYEYRVDILGVQSQKTDFHISFPSKDGFRVTVRGTVEWAVEEKHSPEVFVLIGDHDDIVQKVIHRSALSMSRIQGSKYTSADVIKGSVRMVFQDEFSKHITAESAKKYISIKSALISDIEPPQRISEPIRAKEIAVQTRDKYEQEIARAVSDAEVAKQRKMQDQKQRLVVADTESKTMIATATKDQEVAIINAQRDLDVAQKDLEAARFEAQAIVASGKGAADVRRYETISEANALAMTVAPFGNGLGYAHFIYLQKLNFEKVLTSTEGELVGPLREISNNKQENK